MQGQLRLADRIKLSVSLLLQLNLAIPHRRKSQSANTLITYPSYSCSFMVTQLYCLSVCLSVQSQGWLFIHLFSLWGLSFLFIYFAVIWLVRVWFQLSVWFCLRVGPLSQNFHAAVPVHDIQFGTTLLSVFCSVKILTAHSFIQLGQFSCLSDFDAWPKF